MGQMIDFQRPDGGHTPAWLADAGPGRPGVIVIQEWWGLNDQIRSVADRLATAGYTALAPDLYRGRLASTADEANHMMTGLDFVDATHQDLRGAAAHLAALCPKVGVMGFCMGGALTVSAAVHVPGLSAAVCFYGIPPAELADPARIAVPFMGHFATRDGWCTPQAAASLEATLRGAGQSPEIHHYDAEHAFFNQRRPEVYDAACADLAWSRTLDFLQRQLGA